MQHPYNRVGNSSTHADLMRYGFTLIELLVKLTIIAVLSGAVIMAISPRKQLTSARDAERLHSSKELTSAIYQRLIDKWEIPNEAQLPTCSGDDNLYTKPICKADVPDAECHTNGGVSLAVLPPEYLSTLPIDPVMQTSDHCTGYMVYKQVGRPKVFAPNLGKLPGDIPEETSRCGEYTSGERGGSSTAQCGDGTLDTGETCDDGNIVSRDGCSEDCQTEAGWICDGASPSICTEEESCLEGGGEDVREHVSIQHYGVQFNSRTNIWAFYGEVTNIGTDALEGPFRIIWKDLLPEGSVVMNADGTLTDGSAYFLLTEPSGNGTLDPGETTVERSFTVQTPSGTPYDFTAIFGASIDGSCPAGGS